MTLKFALRWRIGDLYTTKQIIFFEPMYFASAATYLMLIELERGKIEKLL